MKFPHLLLFILSFALLFSACKREKGNVYLPNEGTEGFEGNGYTDSFTLLTNTIREDSLRTDNLSNNLIGIINDPVFGQSKASLFCQFQLPQLGNVLSGTLDSAVLIIQYTSTTAYYGDLNSTVDFNVYELSENMDSFKTHSNDQYQHTALPVGAYSGKFKVSDSITVQELGKPSRISPSIRITLSNTLAQKLFNANASDLSSQASFLDFFKGLAIVPTAASGSGAIAAFNLLAVTSTSSNNSNSKIRIYYNDSQQSDFQVLSESRRLSKYEVTGQSSEIIKQKKSSKTSSFDTTYVQAMTGGKMKIRIPYLFNIAKTKSISIAKAEMIIHPLDGTYNSAAPLPSRLLLIQPSSVTGLNTGVIDLLEPFYGGNYSAAINGYKFNITRHIQNLFIDYQRYGKDNNLGLFLIVPTDYPLAPSRIFVDTRKKMPGVGIEFKLYYAEL